MKHLFEKLLNTGNKTSIWVAGMGPSNVKAGSDKLLHVVGRKDLANATVQNPIFFSTNIEYAYGYAKGYAQSGENGYIGILKVDDMKSIDVLDLTDSKELASIFPSCADSANFYEIFKDAEPYFGFNTGKVQQGTLKVIPVPFIIARLLITYRNQDKLGMPFVEMYKTFEDILTPVGVDNKTVSALKSRNMITHRYKPIARHHLSLDELIFDERLADVDFSRKFEISEYTDLYNEYTMAVFKHSIKKDAAGNFVKDKSGKYELTYYKDLFPDANDKNNKERPVGRSISHGLSLDNGKLSLKIIHKDLPKELSDKDIRHINYYLLMSEELHRWYKNSVKEENIGLALKFLEICLITSNDDSKSNSSKSDFLFKKGTASKYIDNLQYMLYYLISKVALKVLGCYAPEVLAITRTPKKLASKDRTVFLWNTDNLKFIDILNYRDFDDIILKIDDANANGDKDSPFYSVGKEYDDDALLKIYSIAKANANANAVQDSSSTALMKPAKKAPKPSQTTALNFKERFEEFKKKILPLVDDLSSEDEDVRKHAISELNRIYVSNRNEKTSDRYTSMANKLARKRQEYVKKIIEVKKWIRHESEYSYFREALEIYDSSISTDKKTSKLRILYHTPGYGKTRRNGLSRELGNLARSYIMSVIYLLIFDHHYEQMIELMDTNLERNVIRRELKAMKNMARKIENGLASILNIYDMPEFARMRERLSSAENALSRYKKRYTKATTSKTSTNAGNSNALTTSSPVDNTEHALPDSPQSELQDSSPQEKTLHILWLDDMRNPDKYLKQSKEKVKTVTFLKNKDFYDNLHSQYSKITFTWVKNLSEFSTYISSNGLPEMVSFDYDLGKDLPKGSACAEWLVKYCTDNNLDLPKYYIHSANRGGSVKILNVLLSYHKDTSELLSEKIDIFLIFKDSYRDIMPESRRHASKPDICHMCLIDYLN